MRYSKCKAVSYSTGTANTPINLNRNSTGASSMQDVKVGVTSTGTGTTIQLLQTGGGSGGNSVGGSSGSDEERVLKPNTNYVITITPSGSLNLALELFWYEEENGV